MTITGYPRHLGEYLAYMYGPVCLGCSASYDGTSYVLDWDADLMGDPPPTIEDVESAALTLRRAALHEARAQARLAAQTGGFRLDGATYASDREESIPLLTNAALSAQLALAQGAEATAAFEAAMGAGWRDTAGVGRIASAVGILTLHGAFVGHGAACDRHSQALKGQIEAAQSVAELDAIDLTTGWPE